jgi:sulfofructose kinase
MSHAASALLATTCVSSARSAPTRWATSSWRNLSGVASIPSTASVPTPHRRGPSSCSTRRGERTIIAVDSGTGPSSFLPVRWPDLRSADCVYIEGYTRYPPGTATAAESALVVTSPPVPGATTWPATVVVGSETQYHDLTSAGIFEAIRSVSGERLEWVVVTRGREGADAYAASGQVHVDAVAADQIDATGAGDAFTVGMLHGLLRGDGMVTALQAGAAWGAATVAQLRSIPVPWEELAGPFR